MKSCRQTGREQNRKNRPLIPRDGLELIVLWARCVATYLRPSAFWRGLLGAYGTVAKEQHRRRRIQCNHGCDDARTLESLEKCLTCQLPNESPFVKGRSSPFEPLHLEAGQTLQRPEQVVPWGWNGRSIAWWKVMNSPIWLWKTRCFHDLKQLKLEVDSIFGARCAWFCMSWWHWRENTPKYEGIAFYTVILLQVHHKKKEKLTNYAWFCGVPSVQVWNSQTGRCSIWPDKDKEIREGKVSKHTCIPRCTPHCPILGQLSDERSYHPVLFTTSLRVDEMIHAIQAARPKSHRRYMPKIWAISEEVGGLIHPEIIVLRIGTRWNLICKSLQACWVKFSMAFSDSIRPDGSSRSGVSLGVRYDDLLTWPVLMPWIRNSHSRIGIGRAMYRAALFFFPGRLRRGLLSKIAGEISLCLSFFARLCGFESCLGFGSGWYMAYDGIQYPAKCRWWADNIGNAMK